MAKTDHNWRICISCGQRFRADDEYKLSKLFEAHFVSTNRGRECMCKEQLKLAFNKTGDAWTLR